MLNYDGTIYPCSSLRGGEVRTAADDAGNMLCDHTLSIIIAPCDSILSANGKTSLN